MSLIRRTYLRHSKAVPLKKEATIREDCIRGLAPQAYAIADARGTTLGWPVYGLVVTSPALRAVLTSVHLVKGEGLDRFEAEPELYYDGPETPRGAWLARLYKELGPVNYRQYSSLDREEYLLRQANTAYESVRTRERRAKAKETLVTTHMPLLPAIGVVIARLARHRMETEWCHTLLSHNFGECEGFTEVRNKGRLVDLEFHIG